MLAIVKRLKMEQILVLKESLGVIKKPSDIFGKIQKMKIDYNQENFLVFFIDAKNKIIKAEIVFKGGLNSCVICPKTLFRKAIRLNSNSMIISHNHPSGNLMPSEEDKNIFGILRTAGEVLDLKVLDSIIFNKKEYYAMEA